LCHCVFKRKEEREERAKKISRKVLEEGNVDKKNFGKMTGQPLLPSVKVQNKI